MTQQLRLLIFIILCIQFEAMSQEPDYIYEIQIGTDNDKFIAYTDTDRNYTYGINANFRWQPKDESLAHSWFNNIAGHFYEIGLNVEAYTPNYLEDSESDTYERPFAGWSYATLQSTYTFKKSYLRFGLEAGILGYQSQAGQIQNWFHENVSNDATLDWTGQIPNQLGINAKATYAYSLYDLSLLDVYASSEASLGNVFTYIWPRIHFRFGKFNKITESLATLNSVLAPSKASEIFFEYGLGVRFSAYNATIQGNIFDTNCVFHDNDINHAIFTMHLGLNLSVDRFSFIAKYQYGTGEYEYTKKHSYGMFNILYRFN